MKPSIIENCPKIQIGGIKNNSSAEHLIVLKTWMKLMETQNKAGIFQAFDMEKFFDKEGLIDTLYTIYTKGKILEKDYSRPGTIALFSSFFSRTTLKICM